MFQKQNSESGAVLVMSLFLISIFSVLIIGFLNMVSLDTKISRYDAWSQQSIYVASSGIQETLYQLRLNPDWNAGFMDVTLTSGQQYSVTVSNNNPTISIISTGTANGFSQQVEATVSLVHFSGGSYQIRIDEWKLL